jgi:hypothetical protein
MAGVQIDWSMLRPVDIGGAFQQGQAQGRLLGRQRATEDILASYGANPEAGVPNPLAMLDPGTYATLAQNDRQRVKAARETQDALRADKARGLAGVYMREQSGVPNALAPVATVAPSSAPYDPNAPLPDASDPSQDIVVTARPPSPPRQPTVSIADVYELDPDLAGKLTTHMGNMADNEREAFADKMGVAAAVAAGAKGVPLERRQAYIDDHADYLRSVGWDDEEIGGLDPHDENLDGIMALGMGADKYLDNRRSDRTQERADRSDARSAMYQSRSDARASAANSRAAVRFKERGLDRAAMMGSGGLRTDLSDLDY